MQLLKNNFFRNVIVLSGGAALAQAVTLCASPILTRLYTPDDFGLFALFMAIVSSLSMAVCGRYEIALVLPKDETAAQHLFGIAIYFAITVSILLGIVCYIGNEGLLVLFDAVDIGNWVYLTPVMLFMMGLYTSSNYFANRYKDYSILAKSKLLRAILIVALSVICGVIGADFKGLLLGNMFGWVFATVYLLFKERTHLTKDVLQVDKQKKIYLKQYQDYPRYNASSAILNGLTVSLPIFFLSRYFPDSVVGCFALVTRVAQTPISFLSQSISLIHLKKVVDLVHSDSPILPYLHRLALILLAYISIPSIVLVIWSPELFEWVFGTQWVIAGTYMQIRMPAIALRFVSSTLSTTLGATQNNHLTALWRVCVFLSTLAVLLWYAPQGDIIKVLIALSVKDVILALMYYMFITQAARYPKNIM